ncbi:hypothetical protein BD779DRAFT_1093073 [Infundibulicybe gibba]|nr:hypothetical protein BD779DRAFT_1093073 [Infundibulicybe gibba]
MARVGRYLSKTEGVFAVPGYLFENMVAQRFIIAQTEALNLNQACRFTVDSAFVLHSRQVLICQKDFDLTNQKDAISFLPTKNEFLSTMRGDAQGLPSLKPQTPGLDNDDDLDVFTAGGVGAILKEMGCEIDVILDEHPRVATVSNITDDSKAGFIKFIRDGQQELPILQHPCAIDSPQNHTARLAVSNTIQGTQVHPVRRGHIFMPSAGSPLTELLNPEQLWSIATTGCRAPEPQTCEHPVSPGQRASLVIDYSTSVRIKGREPWSMVSSARWATSPPKLQPTLGSAQCAGTRGCAGRFSTSYAAAAGPRRTGRGAPHRKGTDGRGPEEAPGMEDWWRGWRMRGVRECRGGGLAG